jgi:hypothetical protein
MTTTPQRPWAIGAHPLVRQFINWRLVPKAKGKPDKVPCDRAGNPINAHDTRKWLTYEEACQSAFGIAMVFSEGDPYFFIDLDNAYNPATGQWSALAQEVMRAFPDAFWEMSQSGTGLHVIGRGSRSLPPDHGCKPSGLGLELYTRWRFCAMTGIGVRGSIDAEYGPMLLAMANHYRIPLQRKRLEVDEGRDDEWDGPEDDAKLLEMALTAKGTTRQQMGQGATFRQLWELDHAALAHFYPASGRADGLPFNYNSIDAHMMRELSYWTGRDAPRMIRLFKQWKGYRADKLEARNDRLLERVLVWGLGAPGNVLKTRPAPTPLALPAPVAPGDPQTAGGVSVPAGGGGGGQPTPDDFLAHVPNNTFYHIPTGQFYPPASVDNILYPVAVAKEMDGLTPKSIKATKWLAQNRRVDQSTWFPGQPLVIHDLVIRDGVWTEHGGMRVLNLYKAPLPPRPRGAGLDVWFGHMAALYPEHWGYLLDWMAFVAQNPTVKVNFAMVLGGAMRIGKDNILEPFLRAIGEWNSREVRPEQILNSEFNDYLVCRLLKINEAKDMGGESRFQFYEKTKTIIAAPPNVHNINAKFQPPMQIPNLNATIITTNHRTGGLYLHPDDERHAVLFSNARKEMFPKHYWDAYFKWMHEGGGAEEGAAHLMTRDVSQFDPKRPIHTAAFHEMVEGGQSAEHNDLLDVIERMNGQPFTLDQLSIAALSTDVELSTWIKNRGKSSAVKRSLNDLGYVQYRNHDDKQRGRWLLGGKLVTLYHKG